MTAARQSRHGPLANAGGVLAIVLVLAGCTPWPDYATGGLAERHPIEWRQVRTVQERYNALTRGGADRFYPGRMIEVRNLINRAMREHEGGLPNDADVTLAIAAELTALVEADMQRRTANFTPPRK